MKKIFAIYKSDIMKIVNCWVAIVIILGMIILPPLYAWINIFASWDPYSNTKGVKVAVVNNDVGTSIKNIDFDIGSELITSLKTNEKMGWVFCDDADAAIKMAERGDVYATIIIPNDFSKLMTTILDPKPIKPSLQYYVNEKENAIAPKMTDSVVNTLQKQVTTSIIETAVEKAFEKFNSVGVKIENNYSDIQKYLDDLSTLDENVPKLDSKIANMTKNIKDGSVKINKKSDDFILLQDTLQKTIDFNDNFASSLLNIDSKIKEYSPELKENLSLARSVFSNISTSTGNLADNIVKNKPEATNKIDDAIGDLNTFEKDVNDISNKLLEINNEKLPDVVKLNNDILSNIKNLRQSLTDLKSSINTLEEINPLLKDISNINTDLVEKLDSLENVINTVFKPIDATLSTLENISLKIEGLISNIQKKVNTSTITSSIEEIKSDIFNINEKMKQNPQLYASVISLNSQLYNDLQGLSTNIDDTNSLVDLQGNYRSISAYISSIRASTDAKRRDILYDIDKTRNIFSQVGKVCKDSSSILYTLGNNSTRDLDNILARLDDVEKILNDSNTSIIDSQQSNSTTINNKTNDILEKTKDLKTKLNSLKQNINDKNTFETILYDTQKLTYNISSSLDTLLSNLDDNILPRIESYLKNGSIFIGDINNILNSANDDITFLRDFLKDVSEDGMVASDKLDALREKLPKIQTRLKTVSDVVDNVNNNIGLGDIVRFLKNDPSTQGDFVSSPVQLSTHKIYSMPNYGTGLTPFYTVLALWVGALFLPALLTTKAKNIRFVPTPTQEYFAKYMLFATIAVFQGVIVALGDIFILRVSVHNPILFIVLAIFYSLLFSMIIYSLVATLGNVGKAIAIVFMLLQLTGSGGTFPIQVTPQFFQAIHNVLPFTYAISAMREAIYGVVFDALVKDIGVLLVFFALFTGVGTALKKPLNKFLYSFSKQLSDTHIMEH